MDVCAYPAIDQSAPRSVTKLLSDRDRTNHIRSARGGDYPRSMKSRSRAITATSAKGFRYLSSPVITSPRIRRVHKGKHELILPLIELELSPGSPNYQLVENYWDWFWHWR
jgi:hypothetical protein